MLHPLNLTVLVLDVMSMLLYLVAGLSAVRILSKWNPTSATRTQLDLERQSEGMTYQIRLGSILMLCSSLLFLFSLSNIMPELVPGAMCGTGVVRGFSPYSERIILFRFLFGGLACLLLSIEKLNRSHPEQPLILLISRLHLVTLPVLYFIVVDTSRGFCFSSVTEPVDCCNALYMTVRQSKHISFSELSVAFLNCFFLTISILFIGNLAVIWFLHKRLPRKSTLCGFIIGWLWGIAAYAALIQYYSAYHYEVLNHHCPWCFFLKEHHYIGFIFFTCLLFIIYGVVVLFAMTRIGHRYPVLWIAAMKQLQQWTVLLFIAMIIFIVSVTGPAISWRYRFGIWLQP